MNESLPDHGTAGKPALPNIDPDAPETGSPGAIPLEYAPLRQAPSGNARTVLFIILSIIGGGAIALMGAILVVASTFTFTPGPYHGRISWGLLVIFSPGLGILSSVGIYRLCQTTYEGRTSLERRRR